MSLDEWVKLLTVVQSLVTIVAIVVGGIWAYTKFIYRREKEPRAEFSVDLDFIGSQGNSWLVEVSAYVENRGLVRQPVRNFKLRLRYLYEKTYIDPGLKYRNSYVTSLPLKATFVLLQGSFEYGTEPFTAQKLFKVPD